MTSRGKTKSGSNRMSENTLPQTITTQELMALDYRYHYSDEELLEDWRRLKATHKFKKGSQFKPGMKLCQHFFENFWLIKNDKNYSFADAWRDPDIMDDVREWGLKGMSRLWLSWIRRAVYMRAGLPNSSFYRPHFAKQVCMMQMEHSGNWISPGRVFDPCMGWGGRLLGSVAQGWHYTGCDPNPATFANLSTMTQFLGVTDQVSMHNTGAEKFDYASMDPVDVVITSPPYFNLEIYTDEPEQSYNQHKTYADWRDGWYVPTIESCLGLLQPNGISAWNVMNSKKNDMVGDLVATHERLGWYLTGTVGFDSPLANIRKLKNRDVTYLFRRRTR